MTDLENSAAQNQSLGALESLQENASAFFARTASRYGAEMACKEGCSACCYVTLEVFESEATRIVAWAQTLPADEQGKLRDALVRAKEWGQGKAAMAKDAAGNMRAPCPLLEGGRCTVYAARPVICRTQGAPLQLRKEDSQGRIELSVDVCPLNFRAEGSLPAPAEWLDLTRLTVMQSLAERQFQTGQQEANAPALPWKKNAQRRVSLAAVRRYLLDSVLVGEE